MDGAGSGLSQRAVLFQAFGDRDPGISAATPEELDGSERRRWCAFVYLARRASVYRRFVEVHPEYKLGAVDTLFLTLWGYFYDEQVWDTTPEEDEHLFGPATERRWATGPVAAADSDYPDPPSVDEIAGVSRIPSTV